ncbi:MAG: methionine--tRNA ligase [Thermoplasmata archaeon]|nr:methionine--tRNA ligase [Thermoplasmata archaeon]
MARIFIGVAWPYANGVIHVGGMAGCYLPPDIFARYHRMKGNDVLMVSGSDMHGTPTTVRAEEEGVEPKVIADRFHEINMRSLERFGLSFDLFLNTEHPTHLEVVKDFMLDLWEKGHIYESDMTLPFCENCSRYLPDRYVEGTCPHCGHVGARGDQCDECGKILDPEDLVDRYCVFCKGAPEMKTRGHLFFRLTAFEDQLKEYIKDKNHWRPNVLNFTRNWLENGLVDRPVSRDIKWGIPIPIKGHEDKMVYVWFEAFMGYFSMAVEWARRQGDPDAWKEYWQNPEARHYYFLGKDNIPFHAIFWPAVLMARGDLNLPYDVPANEFMRFEGAQFSKSTGVTLEIDKVLENFPADAVRYYLTVNMPENRDSDFTWKEFVTRNNTELLATYGNFAHRVLTFVNKHFGEVPPVVKTTTKDDEALERIERTWKEVDDNLERVKLKDSMKKIMSLARFGNQYFDAVGPWTLVKVDKEACGTSLHVALRIVKALCVLSAPFLPFSSARLWKMLGYESDLNSQSWEEALNDIEAGQKIGKPSPLFKKIELPEGEASVENLLDIRVGKVISIEDHPDAEKLYVMSIDLGDEKRQIVAGLKGYYTSEELMGKDLVMLCNLQPAKLRGVESNAMLMAAEDKEIVSVLLAEGSAPGTQVLGSKGLPVISFEDFKKLKIVVAEGEGGKKTAVVLDEERTVPLKAQGKPVTLHRDVPAGSQVK